MDKVVSPRYVFVRDLTPQESSMPHRVGLYTTTSGASVVIKRHASAQPDQDTQNLLNEAAALKLLNSRKATSDYVRVPSLLSFEQKEGVSRLVMSAVTGGHLDSQSKSIHANGLARSFDFIQSSKLSLQKDESPSLPVRTAHWYMLRVLFYAIREVFIAPSQVIHIFTRVIQSLGDYFASFTLSYDPVLTHGGLYVDSILYDQTSKTFSVIDWESAHYAHPAAELAAIRIFHDKYLSPHTLNSILSQHITSPRDLHMFYLVSAYLLFTLGRERSNFMPGLSLFQCMAYLRTFKPFSEISPYEYVHHLTFYLISQVSKYIPRILRSNKNVILCYHSISDTGWRYATSQETFKQHLQFLKKRYTIAPLHQVISAKEESGLVAITFDDGYSDVYGHAFPILREFGAVATVFALGSPEKSRKDELENTYPMMSDVQLKKLSHAGWEIGYHTDTHPDLHVLSDAQLRDELITSKVRMENRTGLTLRYFAYPKGKYSAKIIGIVKEAGYTAGFTVDGGQISVDNTYTITRLPIEGSLSVDELEAQMTSIGLMLGQLFMTVLRLKDRSEKLLYTYIYGNS